MRIVILTTLAAITATMSPARVPQEAPTSHGGCASSFENAIATGTRTGVPAACWQIGPLQLGMAETDVERLMGKPVAQGDTNGSAPATRHRDKSTLYAFMIDGSPTKTGRERLWLLALRYRSGRLVTIDTSPGARIDANRCAATGGAARRIPVSIGRPTGPLSRFGSIAIGDPLSVLVRTFHRSPSTNRSHDWYNFLPVPISFDVDPDRSVITGMKIATDDDAFFASASPRLNVRRDPVTCRMIGLNYSLQGG